ncbi:GMC family oxidoreductase [Pseudomonas sp. Z1-29]|uniref:GMC oxidoreductase n=1 Tax=Pseudomonas sp. Z1-29 TaxID=2817410 RepID=UPI003DA8352B
MRSGIGPSAQLRSLDIPVVADLPVGARLQDHPLIYSVYALKAEHKAMLPAAGALVWTGSKSATAGNLDLQISATHFFDPTHSPTGGAIVLASALVLPRSFGSLRLVSRDPRVAPCIHYNFLDDPSDLERLMEVARLTSLIASSEPFAGLIDSEITPPLPRDDAQLRKYIIENVSTYAHPTSTVPMGRDDDPTAVVDAWGAVRGIRDLHVVDASIFPDVPSVPTNVTTVMVAERIAARLGKTLPSVQIKQFAGVDHDY